MDESACLIWGIDNIHEIEQWNCGLKVIDSIPMYKEHKRNYSLIERIGMSICDALKIMSLAHVKIHSP